MFPHTYFPPALWLNNGTPTSASEVLIANFALDRLGAGVIDSFNDDTKEANIMNRWYSLTRDAKLREFAWRFSIHREVLMPSSTAPAFGSAKAFPLPNGCLRVLLPSVRVDWEIENVDNVPHLLSCGVDSVNLRFIKRVTEASIFDPLFINVLALELALATCESITQSTTKKDAVRMDLKEAFKAAKKANAFEVIAKPQWVDPWLEAMDGGRYDRPDLRWGV